MRRRGDNRDPGQPAPARQLERPADDQVPDDGLEGHEGVHPGVRGVINRPRRARPEQQGGPGDAAPAGTLAGRPQEGQGGGGDDARKGSDGEVALPEREHPVVKEQIVKRGRPILDQGPRHLL